MATSGLRGTDVVHKIVESMRYHGIEVVVYDKVAAVREDGSTAVREGGCPRA